MFIIPIVMFIVNVILLLSIDSFLDNYAVLMEGGDGFYGLFNTNSASGGGGNIPSQGSQGPQGPQGPQGAQEVGNQEGLYENILLRNAIYDQEKAEIIRKLNWCKNLDAADNNGLAQFGIYANEENWICDQARNQQTYKRNVLYNPFIGRSLYNGKISTPFIEYISNRASWRS